MDNYIEQIVKTTPETRNYVEFSCSIIMAIFGIVLFLLMPLSIVGIVIFAGGAYLIYFTGKRKNLEYEYEITNGDVSIDRIFDKSSRRNAISFAENEIDRILLFNSDKFQNELDINKKMYVYDFTSRNEEMKDDWYVFMISAKKESAAVVVELNEKSKEHVESYFKKRIER